MDTYQKIKHGMKKAIVVGGLAASLYSATPLLAQNSTKSLAEDDAAIAVLVDKFIESQKAEGDEISLEEKLNNCDEQRSLAMENYGKLREEYLTLERKYKDENNGVLKIIALFGPFVGYGLGKMAGKQEESLNNLKRMLGR